MHGSNRFAERVWIVTGAASGIGAETARRAAAEGARVAIFDVNEAGAVTIAEEIILAGGEAIGLGVDVSNSNQIDEAVRAVHSRWNRIDVLINNAGIPLVVKPVTAISNDEFHTIVNVNLFGTFACTRAVAPYMVQSGFGRIINLGSRTRMGEPRMSIYAATKTAMEGFSKSIALELGPYGITVNVVAPGSVDTPARDAMDDREGRDQRLMDTIPMQRRGRPGDIAETILFLCSEQAEYITMEVITVSGGRYTSSSPMGLEGIARS